VITPACPLCGGATSSAFTSRDRNRRVSDKQFTYYRCERCGTLALWPVPDDIGRYYPQSYYALPRGREELLVLSRPEQYKVEMIRRFVTAGDLLEIGPGVGGFLAAAQAAGFLPHAIEMDSACCAFLRTELGAPVTETDDPASALESGGSFDVIALWHVIEHLPDPRRVVQRAIEALRPGGILVLATPNPAAFQARALRTRWVHIDAPRHLVLMPHAALVDVAKAAGADPVLITTADEGGLGWNRFGWRESLAAEAEGHYPRLALTAAGAVIGRLTRFIERREGRGSAYTLVVRRG
jgi:2-polyprenyl-3-methyl-5-hydroxy-6-metoxy-1,4-benzoquinol methylase